VKIVLETSDLAELDDLATIALAIRDAYHLSHGAVTGQQSRKVEPNGHANLETIPDPRQLELPLPPPPKAAKPAKRRTAVEPIAGTITTTCVVAPDQPEEPIEVVLNRVRNAYKEKGVVALRSELDAAGVQRLSDLPEVRVRELDRELRHAQ
jgi:hypothetical protein